MSSFDINNYSIESKSLIFNKRNNKYSNNKSGLIESIPKLNFQQLFNSEKNPKIQNKSRNYQNTLDRALSNSSNNNHLNISNFQYDEENKYDTDNNLSMKCHNNIFDFYDIDNFYNNSTTLETKHLFSNSNIVMNKKNIINKTVRKKKILNLKSFINDKKIRSRNKYALDKFVNILNNLCEKHLRKVSFKILKKYKEDISLSVNNEDEIKLKNFEEKIIKSNNRNKNEFNDIISPTPIKSINNNNEYFNNLCDSNSNSARNYFYYIEQLSARYNREKEENFSTTMRYRPTNFSFVIKNFSNNKIFDNVKEEFRLIKKQCNTNKRNQIYLYKKYYGDIEAINEEDNESEEIKNNKGGKRNKNNSFNKSVGDFNHSNSFSCEDNLDFPINKLVRDMKLINDKRLQKNTKSKTQVLKSASEDIPKSDITIPVNSFDNIAEIGNIKKKNKEMNLYSKNNKNNINKDKIIIPNSYNTIKQQGINVLNESNNYFSESKKKQDEFQKNEMIKNNNDLNEDIIGKIVFSLIIFLAFIISFFAKNLK